jgi:hypothetical protein
MEAPLWTWLRLAAPEYYYKALELQSSIRQWLSYVLATFQHYTSHGVDHSEEIILQVSRLLFRDGRPILDLSPTEVYILVAASYLHDAGMVASDFEKHRILSSPDWRSWTSEGDGSVRWVQIEQFRRGATPSDETLRHFLADVQVRFLLAEFIRRRHHLRSGTVVEQYQGDLGRFAFDDPQLARAIADVCVGHGLSQHELLDTYRFPEERDIRADKVNLRFLAIVLRIGDLLDLRTDRACPLLLNAACPLPAESYAHWTQYAGIRHRMTAPDRIEITADCETPEQHRILQDWCKWLVEEVTFARHNMLRSRRHSDWKPPEASIGQHGATIEIKPSPLARYVAVDWTFELDQDAVFQRLVRDVYDSPVAFVRELIQNALDATRCRAYSDYERAGHTPPTKPTDLPEDWRERYPIRVTMSQSEVYNELIGRTETRQVFALRDPGIGRSCRPSGGKGAAHHHPA